MFDRLGASVWRRPLLWVVAWAAVAVTLGVVTPSPERLSAAESPSLMPADQPYNVALALERRAFPQLSARTRTVLVFERPGGLTQNDFAYFAELTDRLQHSETDSQTLRVQSPTSHPFLRSRLLSSDGQAAMIVVGSDINYVTRRCHAEVDSVQETAESSLPAGLRLEVTGTGGMGRDLGRASAAAYRRTTWVTVTVLLVILAVVYRAPLAATVPLIAVGVSVFCAVCLLNLLALAGWNVGDMEKTFVVVLLFGSGVDFSLFWIWRYREGLTESAPNLDAFVTAMSAAGPAIVTSAATTIAGFWMLAFADLLPSHNAGRALAVALGIALAAAITLVPATARLMGRALLWPQSVRKQTDASSRGVWGAAARLVTRRPRALIVCTLLLMAGPAWAGLTVRYQYDALGILPPGSSSARGRHLAEQHFTGGQLFSWSCLIESPDVTTDTTVAGDYAEQVSDILADVPGIADVWSLAHPLGRSATDISAVAAASIAGRAAAASYYVNADTNCERFEVMLDAPPLSRRAMESCQEALDRVQQWANNNLGDGAVIHATGPTPYILNIKHIAAADQRRVMVLVAVAIGLIVLVWVRRPVLTLCMIGATLAVYAATLGAADIVFRYLFGTAGIDWKVQLFVFVVLVAVGQDYNIFVVSRIRQERMRRPPLEAVDEAVRRTGSVISSCGLIMAATLASLAATGMPLLQQLGFAFAFGVLLDTFVVRPLLLPALYLLCEGKGR